ncbi:MAG: HEPN domain-containing protein [Ignavibacteriaceae bacterium]
MMMQILKAQWVKNNENITPPKIHNLVKLYHESNLLSLNKEELVFLNEVTEFNLEGRYPETKLSFYRLCTKEFTEEKIKRIKELYQCLQKEM